MDTANREKQAELMEVHYKFQEQGKRLTEALTRLVAIGGRLENEPNIATDEKIKEPSPRMPGITTDLWNDAEGFRQCITAIENQLSKIERHI